MLWDLFFFFSFFFQIYIIIRTFAFVPISSYSSWSHLWNFYPVTFMLLCLQLNFPERQYRTYVMSLGVIITFAWNIVSNFLDPGTVFKIRLVTGFGDPVLLQDFSAEQIKDIEDSALTAPGKPLPALPSSSSSS
jgi:hypothetical protein